MKHSKDDGLVSAALVALGITVVLLIALGAYSPVTNATTNPLLGEKVVDYNNQTNLELIGIFGSVDSSSGMFTITLEVNNTENSFNNVSAERNFPEFGSIFSYSMGICDFTPMGIAVVKGNYTSGTIGMAHPLDIYKPGTYECGVDYIVGHYDFLPLSNSARMYCSCDSPPYIGITNFSGSVALSGFWTYTLNSQGEYQDTFHHFSQGGYTIVGADCWGDYVFMHFYVV